MVELESLMDSSELLLHHRRHFESIEKIKDRIQKFDEGRELSLDIRYEYISGALDGISELTGAVWSEEILDEVFKNFCIGK